MEKLAAHTGAVLRLKVPVSLHMPSPTFYPCTTVHTHTRTFLQHTPVDVLKCVQQAASFVFHGEHVLADEEKKEWADGSKDGKRRGTKSGKFKQELPLFHFHFDTRGLFFWEDMNIKTFKLNSGGWMLRQEAMWHWREPERARSGPEERGRKVRDRNKIQTRECKQVI